MRSTPRTSSWNTSRGDSMAPVWRVLAKQLDYYQRTRGTDDYTEAELVAFLRKAGAARFAERLERLAT
ncbi:hypothetical protein ABT344_15165 [Micromonospora carbonacea]|uniref:hypothetical protein n=1 Tax=Micromonospora carbonacea TaxID=47853 RepID=UPI003325EB75